MPMDSSDQNRCRTSCRGEVEKVRKFAASLAEGVLGRGPDSRWPILDCIAVVPLPRMILSSTISQ